MPAVLAPGQVRLLGWKIHTRCLASSSFSPHAAPPASSTAMAPKNRRLRDQKAVADMGVSG